MTEDEACVAGPIDKLETTGTLLTVDKVSKAFPMNDGSSFLALKDLSLIIEDHKNKPQIVSLLGPSGAGKTTALRIIAALEKPTSGCVMISDGVVNQMRPVRVGDVGVVFQRYPLFEDQNVLNNLIEPAVRA